MTDLPKPPARPCGTCPYRRDVPSGVWAREEYEKLTSYDGDTLEQCLKGATRLFMCHQRDGCLCGGWLMAHDRRELAALRVNPVGLNVWDYDGGGVPVFASGQEAHDHGVRDLDRPGPEAQRKIDGLVKAR